MLLFLQQCTVATSGSETSSAGLLLTYWLCQFGLRKERKIPLFMIQILHYLKDPKLLNYGLSLIMGNARFVSSTALTLEAEYPSPSPEKVHLFQYPRMI